MRSARPAQILNQAVVGPAILKRANASRTNLAGEVSSALRRPCKALNART